MPYLVTELLEGESLRARLAKGALPLREAVGVALQVARGLAAAHDKGIVHRDLKPDNVFVIPGGGVKILDFGIAKLFEPDPDAASLSPEALAALSEAETQAHAATGWGVLIGTPAYMSPEQARGERVDSRSDVFSFGIVLYEMLTGVDPFRRHNAVDTLGAILKEVPLPAQPGGGRCPAELQKILRLCLAKDPSAALRVDTPAGLWTSSTWPGLDNRILTPGRIAAALALLLAVAGPLVWIACGRPSYRARSADRLSSWPTSTTVLAIRRSKAPSSRRCRSASRVRPS